MSETIQIDEAVRVLNEHKWRGRNDWNIGDIVTTSATLKGWQLRDGEAIAIALHLLDAEKLRKVEAELATMREWVEFPTRLVAGKFNLEAENAALRDDLTRAYALGGNQALLHKNETLREENAALRQQANRLSDFIQSRGYVRCDIPACNCNSFHRGHAETRLSEIHREVGETLPLDVSPRGPIDALRWFARSLEQAEADKHWLSKRNQELLKHRAEDEQRLLAQCVAVQLLKG